MLEAAGDDPRLVKSWMEQDYFVSRRFPCLLALVIATIEDPVLRQPLVQNLWEEHGEGRADRTHHALFCDLMRSAGVEPISHPNSSTEEYIGAQESLARTGSLVGLGVFCYANEYITLREFEPLERSARRCYPGADISFFEANRQVDARHAQETEAVILAVARSSSDFAAVEEGLELALDARAAFYTGLLSM